jgi:hypothetical protein
MKPNYDGVCESCLYGMQCFGENNVFAQPGFFRLNATSNIYIPCTNPLSCLGGELDDGTYTLENRCAKGYTGNLCANCVDGYGRTRDQGSCYDCINSPNVYFLLLAVVFIAGLMIITGVRILMHMSDYSDEKSKQASKDKAALFKLLVNFLETATLLKMIPIGWPGEAKDILNINNSIATVSSDFLSLDCLFSKISKYSVVERVYVKLTLFNLLPVGAVLLAIICWFFYFKYHKLKIIGNPDYKRYIKQSGLFVGFFMQSAIINEDFGMFSCVNLYRIDNPVLFLTRDSDIECWTEKHSKWTFGLALPSILLWLFILPIY